MSNKRLKIGYLTATDARDKKSWSGIHYYIAKALEKNVGDIDFLGPVTPKWAIFIGRAFSFLAQKLLGKRYDYSHSNRLAKAYGRIFSRKLNSKKYDIIFAPSASSCIAYLNTNTPIVYCSDSTFCNMIDYYPAYTRLVGTSLKQGKEIESKALAKAALALYPSAWAANSAIKAHNAQPNKVHVFPFGANTDSIPTKDAILAKRKGSTCRLLFLGVEWERKGGPIAFDTLTELLKQNIQAELTVCGCVPPPQFKHEKLKVIPFLNKNLEQDQKAFFELMLNSDFLILPSRRECFGIVFCEASAFGLPSISTDTGGISGAVKNGENGFLLPLSATGKDYANVIASLYKDDEKYYAMVKRSREMYETSLNWDSWAKEVQRLIEPLIN